MTTITRPSVAVGDTIRVIATRGEGTVTEVLRDGRPVADFPVRHADGTLGHTVAPVDMAYELITGPPVEWVVSS